MNKMQNFEKPTIIHLVLNKEWGGGEQYVYDLCRDLQQEGYPVWVVSRPVPAVIQRLESLHARLFTLPLRGVPDVWSAWALARLLREAHNPVIHVHNFKAAFIAVFARTLSGRPARIVVSRHLVRKGKTGWLYRYLYKQVDRIIFVSRLAQRQFLSTRPKIETSKLTVVYNSIIPIPTAAPDSPLRTQFGIAPETPILMYHGRLAEEKGLRVLLKAVAQLQDVPYVLMLIGCGDAAFEDTLQHDIATLHLQDKVHLLGFHANVYPLIHQCDIGLVPSIVAESISLASLEYMSQGKPIVATNNGGQVEIIANQRNGILVPPHDPTAMAQAIRTLLLHPDMRHSMGTQSLHDFQQQHSYAVFYQQIKKVYFQ